MTIPTPIKLLLQAVGISLAIFATFKGIKMAYECFFPPPASQIISSGDQVIRKFKPTAKPRAHVTPQSQGCEEAITGRVMHNYFVFRIYNTEDHTYKQCVGIGIKDRIGIIPRHYYLYMQKLDPVKFKITLGPAIEANHGVGYTFCESDFLVSDVSDLAVFYTPSTYPMFKNIVKYFGTDSDLNGKHSEYAKMIKVPSKSEPYMTVIELTLQGYKKTQTIVGADGAFTSLDNICYNYSQPGACGSVVMYHNHTRPIRGVHIAGLGKAYGGTGFAAIITQEDLEAINPNPNTPHVQGIEEPAFLQEDIKMYLPEECVVVYKGSVSKELIPYSPDKSSIRPSKIHNDLPWKTSKAPAILSKKDPRYKHSLSPLLAGCAKHGKLTHDFATDQLNEIAEIRATQLLSMKPIVAEPSKLTIKEAIIGIPDVEHYEGIKMNTSAGWPYCTTNRTTKQEWTTIIRDNQEKPIDCEVDKEVIEELNRKTALRKQGIVPMTIFVDTLKDEKKAIEKVTKLGGTRVFCASPYDFTIAMRQNYLHFVAAYYANRDRMKHSVGISMVGHEVTQLVTDLLDKGTNIITLDYSNFGPGFNGGVGALLKKTVLPWVTHYVSGVDETELEALIEENVNSHHIMAGTVYQQRGGSPSGSPITVVINSEVNIMYIMLAWRNIVTVPADRNIWQEFEDHVALRVYGDDLIMSVSDEYIDSFNGITITDFFKEFGIVATDAAKTGVICKSSSIYEASYLKHKFAPHPTRKGEWIAALDLDSVKDTPLWIQEAIVINEATRVNAEAGIRNAYGHGPEFFKEFKDNVNKALIKHNIPPVLVTWKELDDNFYDRGHLVY